MTSISRMKIILQTGLIAICLSCVVPAISSTQPQAKSGSFSLLFSNNVAGEYKSCGWKSNKLGGLSGKATLIAQQRKLTKDTVLLLDAGKSLLKNKNSQDKISLIKAQNIAEAYILMGYDAVAVSEADLTLESTFLRKTHEKGFPWISANIVDKNGLPALRSHVIKTINSMDIGIIGITDGLATSDTYTTIDYHEPLKQLTDQLAVQTDLIILLSNLKLKVNQEIAKQYPDIDIILSSDRSSGRMPPKTINNCLITQTSSRGKYLGKLNIEWNNGTAWHNDRVVPLSVLIKTKTSIETQLTNLKDSTSKKKIARLQLRHQRLVKEIEARRALGEDSNSLTNKHKLSFIPIQPTHAPQQVELVVENIDKLIHKERKAQ